DWFQKPNRRDGTSYRIINLIVALQILTIMGSGGNVYLLAGLYAFGVVWSFAFNGLAVLRLRYTEPQNRQWKVPGNLHFRGKEIPLGILVITAVLFITAIVNLLTKKDATIAGVIFTVAFYIIFTVSERQVAKQRQGQIGGVDKFRVYGNQELGSGALGVRPGNILVAVRDPRNLYYLRQTLTRADTSKQDVVVMTARVYHREHTFSGSIVMEASEVFDQYEQELFTSVVATAEKEGKPVSLLVVPATNVFDAIVVTAQRLGSSRIVCGLSNKPTAEEQGRLSGDAWERLAEPRPRLDLEIALPDGDSLTYSLGPHTPRLRPEDLELLHKIWLEITANPEYRGLHHYHVVALALRELQRKLKSANRNEVLELLENELIYESESERWRKQQNE